MNPARIIITGFLSQSLFKAVLAVILGLILYGIVDGRVLVVTLVLFTLVQLISIAFELISGLGPALPEETAAPLSSGHLPPEMAPTRLGETSAPANERPGAGAELEEPEPAMAGAAAMLPPRSAIELGAEAADRRERKVERLLREGLPSGKNAGQFRRVETARQSAAATAHVAGRRIFGASGERACLRPSRTREITFPERPGT